MKKICMFIILILYNGVHASSKKPISAKQFDQAINQALALDNFDTVRSLVANKITFKKDQEQKTFNPEKQAKHTVKKFIHKKISAKQPLNLQVEPITLQFDTAKPTHPEILYKLFEEKLGYSQNDIEIHPTQNTGVYYVSLKNTTPKKIIFFLKFNSHFNISNLRKIQEGPIGKRIANAPHDPLLPKNFRKKLPVMAWIEKIYLINEIWHVELIHVAKGSLIEHLIATNTSIRKCAKTAGAALATFQQLFLKKHNSNDPAIWTTLSHGDLHIENILYNVASDQIFFIDLDTMLTDVSLSRDIYWLLEHKFYENIEFKKEFLHSYILSFSQSDQLPLLQYLSNTFPQYIPYLPTQSDLIQRALEEDLEKLKALEKQVIKDQHNLKQLQANKIERTVKVAQGLVRTQRSHKRG
jgi:hypothetical protein